MVNQAEKQALLMMVLRDGFGPGEMTGKMDRVLVFTRTKHGADRVVRKLAQSNIPSAAIHGNKSQPQRERALADFRDGKVRVLIATDIAARGIDIPGVSHVVNFDLPDVPEQYVHRIGRTARAGADGIAIAFCAPDERGNLRDIERTTRQRLPLLPLPADFMASAEAFKRLKPPVEARPERSHRPSFKADRRHDGQQRNTRNSGPQRHPQRADGHPAHRAGAQDRNGQRRDEHSQPRREGSYRPEAYREAGTGRRPEGAQRQPQQGEARGGYRPPNGANGAGQPNRKFHGRPRRPGGGPRRANG